MANRSRLVLSVAGSRKTQGVIEACASAPATEKLLVLTYTTANQNEIRIRLAKYAGDRYEVEVMGWFSFLLRHFVRPYLPYKFPGRRVKGFNFEGEPARRFANDDLRRYMDGSDRVYKIHLPQLATMVDQSSNGLGARRVKRLYDRVYIDEVQDLCGYDLEILKLLLREGVRLEMVGDVRQAVLATNPQESKNAKYKFMGVWDWFKEQEQRGILGIEQSCDSWRCRPEICQFADLLFGSKWGFQTTHSLNSTVTEHDGLFLVRTRDLQAYIEQYDPLFLRHSKNSGKGLEFTFMNYKISKGLTRKRVLILPTKDIQSYLTKGYPLQDQQAAELYVAVTRAEQSVAFVIDVPGTCQIPYWIP